VTNSATIDTTCVSTGTNNAAEYVRAKTIGGLTDWFLPSIDEMLALYNQSALLTGVYATNQDPTDVDVARYLISSQGTNVLNAGGAYMQGSAFPGASGEFSKSFGFAVRPMRMFTATERSVVIGGGPEPVLQQIGKTAAGTCLETAPESLNWAGVSSGGWGESWAQWVNGGNGGAVCTRTLIYNTAQSRWIVG
jgi:hypothetical protein